MTVREVYQCQCENCQQPEYHPDQKNHHMMNLLLSRLDEQQRRWYAALEAKKLGHGGLSTISEITGLHVNTIGRAQKELSEGLSQRPTNRVRVEGSGRKAVEKRENPRKCFRISGL